MKFGVSLVIYRMKKSILIRRKGNLSSISKLLELTGIREMYPIIDNTLLHNVLVIIGEDLSQ